MLWTEVQAIRDLPKDERALDALIERHLRRVMGAKRAEIVLKTPRGEAGDSLSRFSVSDPSHIILTPHQGLRPLLEDGDDAQKLLAR
jgi:hypothetical protein